MLQKIKYVFATFSELLPNTDAVDLLVHISFHTN